MAGNADLVLADAMPRGLVDHGLCERTCLGFLRIDTVPHHRGVDEGVLRSRERVVLDVRIGAAVGDDDVVGRSDFLVGGRVETGDGIVFVAEYRVLLAVQQNLRWMRGAGITFPTIQIRVLRCSSRNLWIRIHGLTSLTLTVIGKNASGCWATAGSSGVVSNASSPVSE